MAGALKRVFTVAAAAPGLLALADKAGPTLREFLSLVTRAAELLKDPAMAELTKGIEKLVGDLDLGGPAAPTKREMKEAVEHVVTSQITPEQQRLWDRETQMSGL